MSEYIDFDAPKFYCEKCGRELELSTYYGSIVRVCPVHEMNYREEEIEEDARTQ